MCEFTVEMESEDGYRYWSGGMREGQVDAYITNAESHGSMLSDIDHTGGCKGTCSDPIGN